MEGPVEDLPWTEYMSKKIIRRKNEVNMGVLAGNLQVKGALQDHKESPFSSDYLHLKQMLSR